MIRTRPGAGGGGAFGLLVAGALLAGGPARTGDAPAGLKVREVCTLGGKAKGSLTSAIAYAGLSRDGKRVLSCGMLEGLTLWDVDKARPIRRLGAPAGPGDCAAFSADGKRALTGGRDLALHVWNTDTGREVLRLRGHTGAVQCAVFSPSGRTVLTGAADRQDATARVWSTADGREMRRLVGHALGVSAVAFAPDGKRMATGGREGEVCLWAFATGKELRRFRGHTGIVRSLAFSPDGKRILSGGADRTLRLWDAETGQELLKLAEPRGAVNAVAFLPGGRFAVSGAGGEFSAEAVPGGVKLHSKLGKENAARLWDLETGRQVHDFSGHERAVIGVGVSANGRRVMTASWDGVLRVWELPDAKELPGAR